MEALITKCNRLSMECIDIKDYAQALKLLQEAKSLLGRSEAVHLKAMTMNNLGCVYKRLGQLSNAFSHFKEALEHETGDSVSLGGTYLNLCSISSSLQRHGEALKYALKAIDIFKGLSDPSIKQSLAVAHYSAGIEYSCLRERAFAQEEFARAMRISRDHLGNHHDLTARIRRKMEQPRHKSFVKISRSTVENTPPIYKKPAVLRPIRNNSVVGKRDPWSVDTTPWRGKKVWKPPGINRSNKSLDIAKPLPRKIPPVSSNMKTNLHFDNRIHFIESRLNNLKSKMQNIEDTFKNEGERKRAAVTIQVYYRAFRLRKQYNQKNRAAILIQKVFRGARARKRIYKEKGVSFKQIMRSDRKNPELDSSKLVKLQAVIRRYLQLRNNKKRKDAAVNIQKHARRYQVRAIFKDIRLAVVFIQSFYRLHRYKKRAK